VLATPVRARYVLDEREGRTSDSFRCQAFPQARQFAEERTKRLDISADRVLQQLAKIDFFDSRKLFNQDGSLKNVNELDADTAPIAGIEIVKGSKIPGKSREARR
jgi:hypothetical protein